MKDNINIKLQLKTVFPDLLEEELQLIIQSGKAALHKKNSIVFKQNEPADALVIILNGSACININDGVQDTIALFLNSSDTFGIHEVSLQKAYPGSLCCLSTSLLFTIQLTELQALFKSTPITLAMLTLASREADAFSYHATELIALPIKFRFIDALITLNKKFGEIKNNTIFIPIKRDQIGSYINASKASLSRIVNELEGLNIIASDRGGINILDEEALLHPQSLV